MFSKLDLICNFSKERNICLKYKEQETKEYHHGLVDVETYIFEDQNKREIKFVFKEGNKKAICYLY